MTVLTKDDLVSAAGELIGENVANLTPEQLTILITVVQRVFDLVINEFERRGMLMFKEGKLIVPYQSLYSVDTVLTRY